jgi:hypothetical protein
VSRLQKNIDNSAHARNVAFQIVKEVLPESTAKILARIVGRQNVVDVTASVPGRLAQLVGTFITRISNDSVEFNMY